MAAYYPYTAAEIIAQLNAAQSGDVVYLPSGTFDCSGTLLQPAAGVRLIGHGDARACKIKAQLLASLGGGALWMYGFSVDVTGLGIISGESYAAIELQDGHVFAERMRFSGPPAASTKVLAIVAKTRPCRAELRRCVAHDGTTDIISGQAVTSALGVKSSITLWDCEAYEPGPGVSDNCLTSHNEMAVTDHRGRYWGTNQQSLVAPALGTRMDLLGSTIRGCCAATRAIGCDIRATGVTAAGGVLFLYGDGAEAIGNRITGDDVTLYGIHWSDVSPGARVESNFISGLIGGPSTAAGLRGDTNSTGTYRVLGNRVHDCNRGYDLRGAAAYHFYNNLTTGTIAAQDAISEYPYKTTSLACDHNIFVGHSFANWPTLGANDQQDTVADLDSDGMPTAGGNCDGTGYLSGESIPKGERDLLGHQRRIFPAAICKGPIERYVDSEGHTVRGVVPSVADVENWSPLVVELHRGIHGQLGTTARGQVNAEADTALSDYDPPTKAELDSGLAGLNDLSAAEVNAEVDTALADYDPPTKAEIDAAITTLIAGALSDIYNRLGAPAGASIAADIATADGVADAIHARIGEPAGASIAADIAAVADSIDVDEYAIADAVLSRSVSNVEATAAEHSLATIILAALESVVSGGTWTIKRTDGTTVHVTKAVTTQSGAAPIVGVE